MVIVCHLQPIAQSLCSQSMVCSLWSQSVVSRFYCLQSTVMVYNLQCKESIVCSLQYMVRVCSLQSIVYRQSIGYKSIVYTLWSIVYGHRLQCIIQSIVHGHSLQSIVCIVDGHGLCTIVYIVSAQSMVIIYIIDQMSLVFRVCGDSLQSIM